MILFGFVCFQIADALTTLFFLQRGIEELNPVMRFAFSTVSSPALGLLLSKLFAVALAAYAWRSGRRRLLRRVNVLFAMCIAWNCAVIAGSAL
jgi:hypothetical protein